MTNRWMDNRHLEGWTHGKIKLLLHTLTIRGSDLARLVEFHPFDQEDSMTDRCMDAQKNNVALAHPHHVGK